jgi:hypothetical protein
MDFSLFLGDRSTLNPKSVKKNSHVRLQKSCFTNKLLDEEAPDTEIARRKEAKQNTWDTRTQTPKERQIFDQNIQKSEEKYQNKYNSTRDESSNPQATTNVGKRILDTTEELDVEKPFKCQRHPHRSHFPSLPPFPLQREPVTANLETVTAR